MSEKSQQRLLEDFLKKSFCQLVSYGLDELKSVEETALEIIESKTANVALVLLAFRAFAIVVDHNGLFTIPDDCSMRLTCIANRLIQNHRELKHLHPEVSADPALQVVPVVCGLDCGVPIRDTPRITEEDLDITFARITSDWS